MEVRASAENARGASAKAELPHVAVLVLNWNAWGHTIECLESLFRMDYPNFSVVLCDNASADGSAGKIRDWARGSWVPSLDMDPAHAALSDPPVPKPIPLAEYTRADAEAGGHDDRDARLILINNGGNLGFAGGNNVGLRYLVHRGDVKYVWILNNDIVVARDALRRLVESAESVPGVGGVGGTLYVYSRPSTIEAAGGGAFSRWNLYPVPLRSARGKPIGKSGAFDGLDFVSGGCLLTPLDAIRRIGLIDESFFLYGEDVDYSIRIRRAGLKLVYAPAARVWHRGGGATNYGSPKHDYYTVRNTLTLVRKHHPGAMPLALAQTLFRCTLGKALRGERERLRAVYRAWSDFRSGVVGPYRP